jgi:peptidylprolyl isomerase
MIFHMKKVIPIIILCIAVFGVWWFVGEKKDEVVAPAEKEKEIVMNQEKNAVLPFALIDATKIYTAILHTDKGDIRIALAARATPITVSNFVSLARSGLYTNTIFHRVIKGFMIQGGDPRGDGTGGPGYAFNDEPFEGEYTRGTVAMANAGPDTNGSQFFIMHADVPLPKNYVIFGHVESGMDVVDVIASAPTKPYGEGSSPVTPVVVQSVEIVEQ